MEGIILTVFAVVLFACVCSGQSILWALIFGYGLFALYGFRKQMTLSELLAITGRGIRTVKNILITFLLIGMLTGIWRACGTIALIIVLSMKLITPMIFPLLTFWLCAVISMLTGTSFGTAGTIGVICMTKGRAIGLSPILLGGAVLSGAFVGDRNSPMSTSALLVAELTKTDIYRNIRNMLRTGLMPLLLSSGIYLAAGMMTSAAGGQSYAQIREELTGLFTRNFALHPLALFAALVIPVCSLLRMRVKKTMMISIILGILAAFFPEKLTAAQILQILVTGYRAENAAVAQLLDGGGICSMLKVFGVVCISSTYAGLFERTGILTGPKEALQALTGRIGAYPTVCLTGLLTAMVACNQSLATILTAEFCRDMYEDRESLALAMENSVIVLAGLIPWSIAGTAPLSAIGAPSAAMAAACFLYLIPLWNLIRLRSPFPIKETYNERT